MIELKPVATVSPLCFRLCHDTVVDVSFDWLMISGGASFVPASGPFHRRSWRYFRVTSPKTPGPSRSNARKPRDVDRAAASTSRPLTRAQVADRLGASISTVRRFEGDLLHPEIDDAGVRWFDPAEVTKVAAMRANKSTSEQRERRNAGAPARTDGEIAALVFERLEQRQSLAEIVMGVRIAPEKVRELHEQWCVGLTEAQLQKPQPKAPLKHETPQVPTAQLVALLAALPDGQLTRISVARHRGDFAIEHTEYVDILELGGFQVAGPIKTDEITNRFGAGEFRISAYGFDPPGIRWEVLSTLPSARK
jgi:hypothetical protein